MSFFQWLKWRIWDVNRCEHTPGEWKMAEAGMRKIKHCTKCGKCTDLI